MNRILSTSLLLCTALGLASCQGEPLARGDRQPKLNTVGGGTGAIDIPNEANVLYETYANYRFDFSLVYPENIVSMESAPTNNDGRTFTSPNENIVIKAYGAHNISDNTISDLYRDTLSRVDGNVTYERQEDNWFVISGYEGDRVFYIKEIIAHDDILTLDIRYDRNLQNRFDPVVATISNSFGPVDQDSGHRVSVFFPVENTPTNEFEAVPRISPDLGVANFAIQQLIAGPTDTEQERGLIDPIDFEGSSNCESDRDFNISINDGTARLRFCRTVPLSGVGEVVPAKVAIEKTLEQFSTVSDVIILNKNGDCFYDFRGPRQCLTENTT